MEREFVGYKEAKQLRKLGFNDTCFAGYTKKEKDLWVGYVDSQLGEQFNRDYHILAPTFSQAFKFFRDKYEQYYTIEGSKKERFQYFVYTYGYEIKSEESFKTYEEAELACLVKLIEIVKENKI